MPGLELLAAFFVATAVFAYMPGPAMVYAAAQTMAGGRTAGWMAVLGIHLGGYVHVIAAAVGLAMLFETVPILFAVLKFAGAAYLCWLGLKLICVQGAASIDIDQRRINSPSKAFWSSVTVEVFNPKTAVFYLAFLPQFADATALLPIWGQLLVLGTIVNVMFSSADVLCVVLADRITSWFRRSPKANRAAQRVGGGLLIALGVHLAQQTR